MALPISGPISFNDLRTETGISGAISLGDGKVQDLLGQTSNINMGIARGKSSFFQFTIPAGSGRKFITTMAYDAGWQGTGDLFAVIGLGSTTGSIVTGQNSWGDITLLNIGTIMGKGGNGGMGGGGIVYSAEFNMVVTSGGSGLFGETGLVVSAPSTNRVQRLVRLNNLGTIAAGGGGGGGGSPQAAGNPGDVDGVGGGGGGGGGGNLGGTGGQGGSVSVIGPGDSRSGYPGTDANLDNPGGGGAAGIPPRFPEWYGGAGGGGGALGASGAAGNLPAAGASWPYGGPGGGGGYGIIGYSNLTVDRAGTIIGTIG